MAWTAFLRLLGQFYSRCVGGYVDKVRTRVDYGQLDGETKVEGGSQKE